MSRLALAETELGLAVVDVESGELLRLDEGALDPRPLPPVSLPLLVDADRHGSRVVAVVGRRPPLVVSDDAGRTWREAGAGLPPGRAVAIAPDHPDVVLFASATRLHLSLDGCRFWQALPPELPEIRAVALTAPA